MKKYRAIGLMSGTSLDGVDAALLVTDGESHVAQEGYAFVPYPADIRERTRALFNRAPDAEVERALTLLNAEAVKKILAEKGLKPSDIDVVGYHGQTISHNPERGHTCQMGDGALLARLTGIDVVNDLRSADVKAGGQGAPLVPVYHQALAAKLDKPVAFLNIGGVANVTYVGKDIIAFDTGPGNALLDDWMREKAGKPFDENGTAAKAGTADAGVLQKLLSHPYFTRRPPKSLDRNAFVSDAWRHLSLEDGAATLAAFTVAGIAKALEHLPEKPRRWVVCGGGRMNAFFMSAIEEAVGAPVVSINTLGLNGDATEAEAFAYLAVRSLRGLPLSFPLTTGVGQPMTGGTLHRAAEAAA